VRELEQIQAEECAAAVKDQHQSARKELGLYHLIALGETVTVAYLEKELALRARLGAMLETCIKRLLQAKGLKSISIDPMLTSVPQRSAPPKVA
jgi:hypothetical protein